LARLDAFSVTNSKLESSMDCPMYKFLTNENHTIEEFTACPLENVTSGRRVKE